jgi:hypothetical protein
MLFQSASATLDISETIVHFGFYIYMMTRKTVMGNRVELTSMKSDVEESVFDCILQNVKCFLRKSVDKVRKMLREMFRMQIAGTSSKDVVSDTEWLGKDMVTMISKDAAEEDVIFWYSFCQEHDGEQEIIRHKVCYGFMPDLPGKDVYPTFHHFRVARSSRSLQMLFTRVSHAEIMCQNKDDVVIPNPLYSKVLADYLLSWVPTVASWNSAVIHSCSISAHVEPDNSNGLCEAAFKNAQEDPNRRLHESHPALYAHWW